jgi:serine/threonine protein kinase
LVDLLQKMFIKDPDERISLSDIMLHDWVTSNGINPFPKIIHPKFELTPGETMNAISKV